MDPFARRTGRTSMHELGLRIRSTIPAVMLLGLIPALVVMSFGGSTTLTTVVYLAAVAVAFGTVAIVCRHLRRSVVLPHHEMLAMLDRLHKNVDVVPMAERGAPIVAKLIRSLNRACGSAQTKARESMARLISLESAFEQVHSVVHSLTEGVLVLDANSNAILANRSAHRWIDVEQRPFEGKPLAELLDDNLLAAVERGLFELAGEGDVEYRVNGVASGDRIVDLAVARFQASSEELKAQRIVVLVDVTESHEVARLKDEFLSAVSHELRTPLTNILSFLELMEEVLPDGDGRPWAEFLLILNEESARMSGLVDDVLEYSHLTTTHGEPEFTDIDVFALVRKSIGSVWQRANQRQINVQHEIPNSPFLVHSAAKPLAQILDRLLDNAIKFTPNGGDVRVSGARQGNTLEIAVADSGPGIPEQHREQIFDRFSQLGDVMTAKPRGTGLGLPICGKLVERLDGMIRCEESPLGGCLFRIVLPNIDRENDAAADEPASSEETVSSIDGSAASREA